MNSVPQTTPKHSSWSSAKTSADHSPELRRCPDCFLPVTCEHL